MSDTVRFVSGTAEREFYGPLHEDARVFCIVLDSHLRAWGWPEIVVTDVSRTAAERQRIWLPIAKRLVQRYRDGETLEGDDLELAPSLSAMTDEHLAEWAREKFSWHNEGVDCAVDLRNVDPETGLPRYAEDLTVQEQKLLCSVHRLCLPAVKPTRQDAIVAWLEKHARRPDWELITKAHGTGPHWHIARRDQKRRLEVKTS